VGGSGCGKTTVYNNLTNSKRKVGNDVTPITTENDSIETSKIPHNIEGFTYYFIDTEGFGSINEKSISKLVKALASVNIFIASKLDGIIICCPCGRLDMLFSLEMEFLTNSFGMEIIQNIVLVFTCTDHLEESFDDWKQKNQNLIPYNFNNRIFGVSKKDSNTYKALFDYIITTTKTKNQEYLVKNEKIEHFVQLKENNQKKELAEKIAKITDVSMKSSTTIQKLGLLGLAGLSFGLILYLQDKISVLFVNESKKEDTTINSS